MENIFQTKSTSDGTRTRNPRLAHFVADPAFRRPMPYPLGHGGSVFKDKIYIYYISLRIVCCDTIFIQKYVPYILYDNLKIDITFERKKGIIWLRLYDITLFLFFLFLQSTFPLYSFWIRLVSFLWFVEFLKNFPGIPYKICESMVLSSFDLCLDLF